MQARRYRGVVRSWASQQKFVKIGHDWLVYVAAPGGLRIKWRFGGSYSMTAIR
jgi:hypothetical protein